MPKFAANLTMLYNELDFLDRFAAAARVGLQRRRVPVSVRVSEGAARRAPAAAHRLVQVLHNLPAGDWAAGERGIACHPDRVGEFQDGVGKAIEYAHGARRASRSTASPASRRRTSTRTRCARRSSTNLRFAADKLGAAGIKLLIEPINTYDIPGFFLIAHAAGARPDPRRRARTTSSAVRHLSHAADGRRAREHDQGEPARRSRTCSSPTIRAATSRAPARSTTASCSASSTALGYDGWIGCEYKPKATTVDGLELARCARRAVLLPHDIELIRR